jgi:hypothetical protein
MKLPHSVCEVLREHVVLESECIDRMYLNVYVPQLQRIGGVVWYLRGHLGQRFASTAGVAPKTEAFVAGRCQLPSPPCGDNYPVRLEAGDLLMFRVSWPGLL